MQYEGKKMSENSYIRFGKRSSNNSEYLRNLLQVHNLMVLALNQKKFRPSKMTIKRHAYVSKVHFGRVKK